MTRIFDMTKLSFLIIITLFSSCANKRSNNKLVSENFIQKELAKWNITVTGEGESKEITFPEDFKTPPWYHINNACKDAGYSLDQFAKETVNETQYPINEIFGNRDSLQVVVLHKNNEVIGIYKSVRPGSTAGGGVMSVRGK